MQFEIQINPIPCPRPRVSKFGTYYPAKYTKWKKDVVNLLPTFNQPLEGALCLQLEMICKKPKKPSKNYPHGDLDNYVKSVMDCLTAKGVWHDDVQVVKLISEKKYGDDGKVLVSIKNI